MNQGKINHVWSMICSGVSIDRQTNNLSIFNVIDQIRVPKNGLVRAEGQSGKEGQLAVPISFNLLTLWERPTSDTEERASVEIRVVEPDKKVRKIASYELTFASGIKRLRSISPWGGIRVSSSGLYDFKLFLKEDGQSIFREVGNVHLDIEILDESLGNHEKE